MTDDLHPIHFGVRQQLAETASNRGAR